MASQPFPSPNPGPGTVANAGTCKYEYNATQEQWNLVKNDAGSGCTCPPTHMGHAGTAGEQLEVSAICGNEKRTIDASADPKEAQFAAMVKRFKDKGKPLLPNKTDNPAKNQKLT